MYTWLVHFVVQQRLAQHCGATVPQFFLNVKTKKKSSQENEIEWPEATLFSKYCGDTFKEEGMDLADTRNTFRLVLPFTEQELT